MGQAHQVGRFMGQFAIVMIIVMVGIPIIIGICAKSWLWLFGSLLAECILMLIGFKFIPDPTRGKIRKKEAS